MATSRSRSRAAEARRRKLIFAAAGVAVVVLAVVIGVLSVDESGPGLSVADVAGSPEIDGEPLDTAPEDPSQDPYVGEPVPVATGEDFDGEPVTIGEPGTPQLLMFMASWCPACQQELPEVVDWMEQGGLPDDVELTTVITNLDDTRPNWPPQDWLEEEGFEGPVLVDDASASVSEAYGLRATPFWVAVDEEGRVVARVAGMLGAEQLDTLAGLVAS